MGLLKEHGYTIAALVVLVMLTFIFFAADLVHSYVKGQESRQLCAKRAGFEFCGYCNGSNGMEAGCVYCPEGTHCAGSDACKDIVCEYTQQPAQQDDSVCAERKGFILCGYCPMEFAGKNTTYAGKCRYCPEGKYCVGLSLIHI